MARRGLHRDPAQVGERGDAGLPTSLPGYLIQLKAQINLDGVAVATSSTALPMGTDLQSTGGFTQLGDPTQWDLTRETSNTLGQATAIGIIAVQLSQLKDRLAATKTKLEAKDVTDLTRIALRSQCRSGWTTHNRAGGKTVQQEIALAI